MVVNSRRIAFYGECSDAEVRRLVTTALGLRGDVIAKCGDDVVALNSSIPNGSELEISIVENSFEQEFVKFENVQAFLANERTWLAWVRTSLSALGVAFALRSFLGAGFVVFVFTSFATGYARYSRVRAVLTSKTHLNRPGLSHQAHFLGLLSVFLTVVYLASAASFEHVL